MSCIILILFVLFNNNYVLAKYNPQACNIKFEKCKTECENSYKITKKDLFGKKVRESKLNKNKKTACNDKCKKLKNLCRERQDNKNSSKFELEQNYKPEDKIFRKPPEYQIIKYKDENGNIYFTNNYEDIPEKYRSNIILEKNNK
ncbi:MAG: hypothetical protein ACRENO_04830 [Thermodesulfobacteriota bacterium]